MIERGEIEIKYAPANEVGGDTLTKPLLAKKFKVMRGKLMNVTVEYDDELEASKTHPERLPKDNPLPKDSRETLKEAGVAKTGQSMKEQNAALNKKLANGEFRDFAKLQQKKSASSHTVNSLPNCHRSVLSEVNTARLNR